MRKKVSPPQISTYICKYQDVDNTQHLIQVKVATHKGQDQAGIQDTISKVVGDAIANPAFKALANKQIDVELCNGGRSYKILAEKNKSVQDINFDSDQLNAVKSHIKISKFTDLKFAKRNRKFKEVVQRLKQCWPNKVPLICLFWKLGIYPLAVLMKVIHPGKIYNTAGLAIKEDPHNRFGLEDALREVLEVLNDHDDLSNGMRTGLAFAEKWRNKKLKHTDVAKEAGSHVWNLQNGQSVAIPGGYWNKDTFEPMLWSFQKDQHGDLTLVEMGYGVKNGETMATYRFNGHSQEKLQNLIYTLMTMGEHPSALSKLKVSPMLGEFYLTAIREMGFGERSSGACENTDPAKLNMAKFKRALIIDSGSQIIEEQATSRKVVREDPLKIVQESIRRLYPEANFSDKAFFSLHIMHSRLSKITKAMPLLKAEQRATWLHRLDMDYKSLERQMDKARLGTGSLESWQSLSQQLKGLRQTVDSLKAAELATHSNRIGRLNKVKKGKLNMVVNTAHVVSINAPSGAVIERLNSDDYAKIEQLKTLVQEVSAGNTASLPAMTNLFSTLNKRTDALINAKQYESANNLGRFLMALLPSASQNGDFWTTLQNDYGLHSAEQLRERSEQIKGFSEEWSKLSHYFWETKIQTNNLKLKTDEMVYMMNISAGMHRMMECRSAFLDRKTGRGQFSLNFEEKAFLAVFKKADKRSFNRCGFISNEKYLRVCEHPLLAQQFNEIKNYFGKDDSVSSPYNEIPTIRYQTSEAQVCANIVPVAQQCGIKLSKDYNGNNLWPSLLDRHKPQGKIFVPSAYSDLVRHDFMFKSLLAPKVSLSAGPFSLAGGIKFVALSISVAMGKEGENFHEKHIAETINHLKGHRLDIVAFDNKMSGKGVAVVPVGTKPGQKADVEMASDQQATSLFLGMNGTRDGTNEIHSEEASSPSKLYNAMPMLEFSAISTAFNTDSTNPVEDFFLQAMHINENASSYYYYQSSQIPPPKKIDYPVHEVFDLILQRPWLLDSLSKNKRNQPSREAQKRFFEVLFKQDLQSSFKEHPEFFLAHAEPLKVLVEKMRKERKIEQLTFLLTLLQTVHGHAALAASQPGASLEVQQIAIEWPHISHDSPLLKQVIEMWDAEKDLGVKVDCAAHITKLFSNQLVSQEPQHLPVKENPEVIARLLQFGGLMSIAKYSATLPFMPIKEFMWIKEVVAPHLDKQSTEQLTPILDKWVTNQVGPIPMGDWQRVPGLPMQWEKAGTRVDLGTLQIVLYNHSVQEGFQTNLPKEVLDHADYMMLFGQKNIVAAVRSTSVPGELIYAFKTGEVGGEQHSYRLLLNLNNNSLKIERLVEVAHKKGSRMSWHQLLHPQMPAVKVKTKGDIRLRCALKVMDKFKSAANVNLNGSSRVQTSGIEQRFEKCGLWVNLDDRKKAVAFVGTHGKVDTSSIRLNVQIDKKGVIKEVVQASNNMKVVANDDKELLQVLSCLPEDQIIFLRNKNKTAVNEIRFVGQNVYLSRSSPKQKWTFHGDKNLEGAQWVMGADRGEVTNKRLRDLGLNIEDVGLTVRKDGQTTLLVWPQAATAPERYKVHAHQNLAFSNKTQHADNPLKITFTDDGKVLSTAAGYMELAYLLACKKEYTKAAIYLQKAREAKIESPEELETLKNLQVHFEGMAVRSTRTAAIQLKALLAIRKIMLEQTMERQFVEASWNDFLKSSQTIDDAFKSYHEYLTRSPFAEKATYFGRDDIDVSLTGEELEEVSRVSNEAFGFMIKTSQSAAELNAACKVSFNVPTADEMSSYVPDYVVNKAKTLKKPHRLLDTLQPDEHHLVNHFFDLYNLIIKQKLTTWDLRVLFEPITGTEDVSLDQDAIMRAIQNIEKVGVAETYSQASKIKKIEVARRILLSLAASQQQGEVFTPYNLKEIDKIKGQVPQGIINFTLKMGIAVFNSRNSGVIKTKPQASLLNKIKSLNPQFATANANKGIKLSGFVEKPTQTDIGNLLGGKLIDAAKLHAAVNGPEQLFGPVLTPLIRDLVNSDPDFVQDGLKVENNIPIDLLIKKIEETTSINLMVYLREQQVSERIMRLEQIVAAKVPCEFPAQDDQVGYDRASLNSPIANTPLDLAATGLWNKTPDPYDAINLVKNDLQASGCALDEIEAVAQELTDRMTNQYTINVGNLSQLKHEVLQQKTLADTRCSLAKNILISHLRGLPKVNDLPRNVQIALQKPDDFSEDEIIHLLKEAYQSMNLADAQTSRLLTSLLFEQVAVQVLNGEVNRHIQVLDNLAQQGVDETNSEWVHSVTEIRRLVSQSVDYTRHLDAQGRMINPRMRRKVLVCEASKGIIINNDQMNLIEQMVENPTNWYELKVGAGKTSVVFPIVLMLLIEKGWFPAAIVKDELMQQNLDSLDRSTRELVQRAGVEFTFSLNDQITPLSLQELYYRLLQVEVSKGYPISSISSIIAIDQKMQLLNEEFNKLIDTFKENPTRLNLILEVIKGNIQPSGNTEEDKKLLSEVKNLEGLQKQLYYLGKIRHKLSKLMIDEADDILNVVCENNVGRGEPVALNVVLQQTQEHLMRVIHTASEEEYPEVAKLRKALQQEQQVSLQPEWIKQVAFPQLVEALLSDAEYSAYVGNSEDHPDFDDLIDHICTVFEEGDAPEAPLCAGLDTSKLGALKHIIQANFKIALRQNPGIDVGTKTSDGFQIGPQTSGQEKFGTIFGDEYDLIVNHYLFYSLHLPKPLADQKQGESFVELGLARIRDQNPEKYADWQTQAKAENLDLLTYLNKPENFQQRMDFLRLQVFDEKRLKRFESQIVINRQHIQHGRQIGGMTGTLNKDAMPRLDKQGVAANGTQKVSTQVVMEAAALHVPSVRVVNDAEAEILAQMKETAKNMKNKAIINQGFDLKNGHTQAVVADIRQAAPSRIYVFVGSNDREFYIWHPDQKNPRRASKHELDNLYLNKEFRQKACFFFSPPDTRGTDFRIPPGKGICYISAKCSKDDFVQTLGRMRKAPYIHSMSFFVSQGVHNRITQDGANPGLTYGKLVNDILTQTDEDKKGKNFKSVIETMRGIVNTGTRNIIFGHQDCMDQNEYWATATPAKRLMNSFINNKLSSVALDPNTGWLEDKKRINLEADFQQSVQEGTESYARTTLDREHDKVARLEAALREMQQTNQMLRVAQLGAGMGFTANIPEMQTWQALNVTNEDLAWLEMRLNALQADIADMHTRLNSTFRQFQIDSQRGIYPPSMPSNGANIPTAQAQVQEVVQQQQQQQQQQQVQTKGKTQAVEKSDHFLYVRKINHLKDELKISSKDAQLSRQIDDGEIQFPNVQVTTQSAKVFAHFDGTRGKHSFFRLMVADDEVTIISRADYRGILKKNKHESLMKTGYKKLVNCSIYSLTSPAVCGTPLVLDVIAKGKHEPFNEDIQQKIVEAKWLLGMSEFTLEELVFVKRRFLNLSAARIQAEKAFCQRYGSPEQVELMDKILNGQI